MPLNIPLPDQPGDALRRGFSTGTNAFLQMMQPILARQQMAQRGQQFDRTMGFNQQHDQRMQNQFDQEMAFNKLKEGRLGSMLPLQRQLAELNIQKATRDLDPRAKMEYIKTVMSGLRGLQSGQGQQQGMNFGQGEGMPGDPSTSQGGIDFDAVRNDPLLRGLFKKELGIDVGGHNSETPEQKRAGEIKKALAIDEAKSTQKKLDEIEKTAKTLFPYIGKVNTISDILTKKPELAGLLTPLADSLGMTRDEDVGTFLSAAQDLQALMAKELSNRGGYGVSKLVEQAKPNLRKSTAYNVGVTKELKKGMKESFEQMKTEYERLSNGKKFPYDFEKFFEKGKRLKFNLVTGRLE